MTREEHLQQCKRRALAYVEEGKLTQAVTSMFSDLAKHEEIADHPAIMLGMMLLASGHLDTSKKVREFIDGFN